MSDYADLVMHHIQKRRIEFATAAALFSVLLHVAILVWLVLGPIEIPFWHAIPDASPPRDIPMQVQNVAREPAQPLVRDAEPGSSAGAQGPATLDANSVERLEIPLDRVDVEPPPTDGNALAPSAVLQELSLPPNAEPWQPRHTIMEVERTAVRDELAARERRRIPRLERVIDAPDVVYPAKPAAATIAAVPPGADAGLAKPNLATMLRRVTSAAPARQDAIPIPDPIARSGSGVLAESAADVTDMQPIESLLSARITTFTHRRDPEYGYFRVDITRRTAEVLPVLAKDILFIQDCSASMSEQRLYFCRQGLINSLPLIGPEDRFNIVAFRDQVESCFEGWMTNSVAARTRAEQFVQGLESRGETDLFTAIRAALGFTVEPGRPVIVILVSDGHATTGLRGGAAIIREFTQANRGAISVFSLGTTPQAYRYLLDLLTYSNRGDSRLVTRGRWDIPKELEGLSEEVRHPVLSEVGLGVAAATPCEVYPVQTMNLYRDRPIVLYGRYPRNLDRVVLQATGQAATTRCDMIFDLDLQNAPGGDGEDLREAWARQKLYHLMGEHARTRNPALIVELDETARTYQVQVPYRDSL